MNIAVHAVMGAADVTDPDISTAFRTYSIRGRKVCKSGRSCVKHGSC